MAQTITIDLTPDGRRIFQRPYLYFSQGDVGQEFVINLKSRFGLEIPAGATVKIEATKPSGFGFSETGVLSDGTVTFTTAAIMTDEAGHFPVELSITASGKVLGTANFNFMVEPDPHPEGTTDGQAEEIIPELTQLVERVEEAASSVLDRQTVTNTLPAGSQASYSFDEETNTQTFGIPQGEAGAGAVDVTASAYSSSKTYTVGDYVIHNDYLYRCTTAITTAEAWTSGHWTQVLLVNEVSDLKSAITDTTGSVVYSYDKDKSVNKSSPTTQGAEANWESCIVPCSEGDIFNVIGYGGTNTRLWMFSDSNGTLLTSAGSGIHKSEFVQIVAPPNAAYLAVNSNYSQYHGKLIKNIFLRDEIRELAEESKTQIDDLNGYFDASVNLADPNKFTLNKYMTDAGVVGNNTSYFYTDYIPVQQGDSIKSNKALRYAAGFLNGVYSKAVPFDDSTMTSTTIPSDVDSIVVTGYMRNKDNTILSHVNLPYIPYGKTLSDSALRITNKNALNGNNGISKEYASISADTLTEISEYPEAIATHDMLSGYCEFSSFDEIAFGYGYGSNYYVVIDDTNINLYKEGSLYSSVEHGITISDYLSFSIIMDNDRNALTTINSIGGNASTELSMGYAKNGYPFIRSTTALSDVKLSAICKDIKNPCWWFGDSYSSDAPERIIGQLNAYGVIDNMLIDGYPGMRSYYDASTGAYVELVKLLNFAIPKYIIWAVGMNDSEDNYKAYLKRVQAVCQVYGIELYAVKIPSVPNIDNTGKNAYIDSLDIKAIDWEKAVNATSAGVWYIGYLSNDNVHPTVLGAQAMAAQTLVDCPAIMQF